MSGGKRLAQTRRLERMAHGPGVYLQGVRQPWSIRANGGHPDRPVPFLAYPRRRRRT